jgi:hypothetical protein
VRLEKSPYTPRGRRRRPHIISSSSTTAREPHDASGDVTHPVFVEFSMSLTFALCLDQDYPIKYLFRRIDQAFNLSQAFCLTLSLKDADSHSPQTCASISHPLKNVRILRAEDHALAVLYPVLNNSTVDRRPRAAFPLPAGTQPVRRRLGQPDQATTRAAFLQMLLSRKCVGVALNRLRIDEVAMHDGEAFRELLPRLRAVAAWTGRSTNLTCRTTFATSDLRHRLSQCELLSYGPNSYTFESSVLHAA